MNDEFDKGVEAERKRVVDFLEDRSNVLFIDSLRDGNAAIATAGASVLLLAEIIRLGLHMEEQ